MERSENDLNALEARLGAWRPAATAIDRDRMLFLAGKASAGSELHRRIASVSIVGLALVAAGMGGMWASERGRRITLEAVVAERGREVRPSRIDRIVEPASPAASSYLVLSQNPEMFEDGGFAPTVSVSPPRRGPLDREPPLSPLSSRRAELMEF